MQLLRIKLVNFRQHADTDIALGLGLTAVIGPNGVGKTTLLEAIAWALYGAPAARGGRDSIKFNRAPARAPVRAEITFALGAHEYRVSRGLTTAELFQDGQTTAIANSAAEVTAKLGRLLGMTRDEFFNTYFTGQKELAVMATLGATERGRFLSRILGHEKLKLAQDKLRERRSLIKSEQSGLQGGMPSEEEVEGERRQADERLHAARKAEQGAVRLEQHAAATMAKEAPAWKSASERRDKVIKLEGDLRLAEHEVTHARDTFQRLDMEMKEALDAKSELVKLEKALKPVPALKLELEKLDQEAKAAGQRRTLNGQLEETQNEEKRTRARLTALGDVRTALKQAEGVLKEARDALKTAEDAEHARRTAWAQEQQEAKTKRDDLREHYKDLKEHLNGVEKAGPDGICPTCARPLGAEFHTTVEELKRQLEEVQVNGTYFGKRVTQLEKEPADIKALTKTLQTAIKAVERGAEESTRLKSAIDSHAELTTELARVTKRIAQLAKDIKALPDAYDVERHDEVRDRLKALETTVKQATLLSAKADRAARLVKDAETAERVLSERETRVKQLALAMKDLGFTEAQFVAARERHEAAERGRREAEVALATARGEVRGAEGQVAAVQRRLEERSKRTARLTVLADDLKVHEVLDQGFTDLRDELNAAMRPELSEIASQFLADLTDGRYHELELDDDYHIRVLEDGIAKPVISGGEEDVANLVLRVAISQMVAERAGQPLSLLVLDEIFGSLDESRRRLVLDLLRRLGDKFPQVVLITHIDSVRESVDRVLRVELDPASGAARVIEDGGAIDDEDVAA